MTKNQNFKNLSTKNLINPKKYKILYVPNYVFGWEVWKQMKVWEMKKMKESG